MDNQPHAYAHARGAPTREGSNRLDLLPPDFVYRFYLDWKELEDQIRNLQASKKSMLGNIRARYGRHQAEALKITMRRALMDKKQRAEQAIFNEMANYYTDLLETEIDARVGETDFLRTVDRRGL